MLEPDRVRIRNNVEAGFRGILSLIELSARQSRPEVEGKITVASEAWQAGQGDLATSLLLDALIKVYEEKWMIDVAKQLPQ